MNREQENRRRRRKNTTPTRYGMVASCCFGGRRRVASVSVAVLFAVAVLDAAFNAEYYVGHREEMPPEFAVSLKKDESLPNGPRLAWFMSFPHSGTTYALKLIRQLSRKSNAGNSRGRWKQYSENQLEKVYPNSIGGPYWTKDSTKGTVDFPSSFENVVTKTHCGGHCASCEPIRYIMTPEQFLNKCCGEPLPGENATEAEWLREREQFMYSPNLVQKAIHLIRNPFGNIVSRFRYYVKNGRSELGFKSKNTTKESFRRYCHAMDSLYESKEKKVFSDMIDQGLWETMQPIPCHAEVFRYVQWHNMAFLVTNEILKIPTYVLHYERFGTHFEETASDLLEFVDFKRKSKTSPHFISGKEYTEFFSRKEKRAIKTLVKAIASQTTWANIKHYFAWL